MSNASFWVCTDFWVNELGAGWTGGPAGLSVFPSRAFPWRSLQNGRDKSSKFLFLEGVFQVLLAQVAPRVVPPGP